MNLDFLSYKNVILYLHPHYMWHSIGRGPIWSFLGMEILRKIGEMVKKIGKNDFPYFGVLDHQKHVYVGRILKKSLQGSIHAQFYMERKGPFGWLLLQPCKVSVMQRKNKFPTLRRCGILVKASPDRIVQKWAQTRSDRQLQRGHL